MWSGIRDVARHLSVAVLAATTTAWTPTAQSADPVGSATFVILMSGVRIGTESLAVSRTSAGWTVSGAGRLQPPVDLTTDRFEIAFGADWQPQQLTVEASFRGQPHTMSTSFGVTTATSEVRRGAQRGSATHQISPRAVVLPNDFFAAYELLALRLSVSPAGTRIPIYIPAVGETTITVNEAAARRVSLTDRALDLREYVLTVATASGARPVELWVDARGRLARLVMPTSDIVAIREDLATVMAREERARHPRDEDAFIGADAFSLGATLTAPAGVTGRAPAVVFVSGPGPYDRDHIAYGVPVFAQLAGTVADAGYLAVRYDPRGLGRSGGRAESARLSEYADDVISVVRWLRRRRDVDERRITIVGYGDGGPIAMLAASREKDIAGLALVASPGRPGKEVTIERQQMTLARLPISDAERTGRVALQLRVIDAVLTGRGWEPLPADLRTEADTLWFKSWLEFDPVAIMRRVNQPVLIVHGALDAEVPPAHAQQLDAIARARKNLPTTHTQVRVVPAVNHLLVPSTTGQVNEYASLPSRTLSPDVSSTVIEWLKSVRRR
jgi:pimeloyl-ACP methyl ester carboxylesterase